VKSFFQSGANGPILPEGGTGQTFFFFLCGSGKKKKLKGNQKTGKKKKKPIGTKTNLGAVREGGVQTTIVPGGAGTEILKKKRPKNQAKQTKQKIPPFKN